jgi:hypothetical protein
MCAQSHLAQLNGVEACCRTLHFDVDDGDLRPIGAIRRRWLAMTDFWGKLSGGKFNEHAPKRRTSLDWT